MELGQQKVEIFSQKVTLPREGLERIFGGEGQQNGTIIGGCRNF